MQSMNVAERMKRLVIMLIAITLSMTMVNAQSWVEIVSDPKDAKGLDVMKIYAHKSTDNVSIKIQFDSINVAYDDIAKYLFDTAVYGDCIYAELMI